MNLIFIVIFIGGNVNISLFNKRITELREIAILFFNRVSFDTALLKNKIALL